MRKFLLFMIALLGFAFTSSISYAERASKVTFYKTTVGTATAVAIAPASVGGNVLGYKICNDAENTSTYLLIGQAVDVSTDGVMLGKGQCFECPECSGASLKLMKVEAQAAANGYSVVQYRQ